jgi:hypothetical protein
MSEVTTTDSDETTLNGTLQFQAAIDARVWRATAGPTLPTAGEGAWVNACADQMLDINERLSLLAGEVTPADSNETTPNGTLQLQAARVQRAAADRSTDGRSNAAAAVDNPITRRCPTA